MPMQLTQSVEQVRSDFRRDYAAAMDQQDGSAMMTALETYAENLNAAMLADYQSLQDGQRNDAAVLASRGVRQLTSAETKYYNALIEAMRKPDAQVKNALTGITDVMPESIVDQVMEDISTAFPLLDEINFVNSTYLTYYLYNKQDAQLASWGAVGSAITKELSGAFGRMSVTQCKLSAYMAISKDYLTLGPAWLDRYVRAVLSEAVGMAAEKAIVDGAGTEDGAPCPIGMTRDLESGTTSDDLTTYAQKDAITVTELTPEVYGSILAKLTKTPTGRYRAVPEVLMVVSPEDYFTKIMPATTYFAPNGSYVNNVLPYPTKIIQSTGCPSGKAVVGIASRYLFLLGNGSKTGVFTYDDSYQFLEDNRVYAGKLLGNGRPMDNNAFQVLDISGLKPLSLRVTTVTDSSDSTTSE